MKQELTGSQTVGPYYAIGLQYLVATQVPSLTPGEEITIEGRLLDEQGSPVPDGFLEIWQAGSDSRYIRDRALLDKLPALQFPGFARVATNAEGVFRFTTVKPGQVPYDDNRLQAPHLLVLVFMRGLLRNLVTRMYFSGEASNQLDPILQLVPADRQGTLIAQPSGPAKLQWDIRLRGAEETVFFAW